MNRLLGIGMVAFVWLLIGFGLWLLLGCTFTPVSGPHDCGKSGYHKHDSASARK